MSAASIQSLSPSELSTLLGGISAGRIRTSPAPGSAGEDDVVRIRDRERRLCELVDGTLVEKAVGYWESVLALELARLLGNFISRRKLGVLAGEAGMLRLFPGLVRIPDISFVAADRLTNPRLADAPILPLAPDLAVEILSAGNTKDEMARKLNEYFAAGCRLVWLINPRERTVAVYNSAGEPVILTEKRTLTGGAVLPGFRLPLKKLFALVEGMDRGG